MEATTAHLPLSSRDRDWLAAYLDSGEDLSALAARIGTPIPDLLDWLATAPVRRALAIWDRAQGRARAVRDQADRRAAIDTLKAAIAASSDPVEKRLAAASILRTLDRRTAPARHQRRQPHRHRARPRFADPAEADRFLERERRENERLEKLLQRVTGISDAPPVPPADAGGPDAADHVPEATNAPEPPPRLTVTQIVRGCDKRLRAIEQQRRREREQYQERIRRIAAIGEQAMGPAARLSAASGLAVGDTG